VPSAVTGPVSGLPQIGQRNSAPVTCLHTLSCPASDAWDHTAARTVTAHPEQGWSLLCNGVIVFDDTGERYPKRTTRRRIAIDAQCAYAKREESSRGG